MALTAGTRLGQYEITAAIGAGGMGEVYRATDTKLGRDVAIKALPSALAADTDRLARFDREAKLLAALNHPNIAIIYGLEEHDGVQCIAMELIEGETLEEKLKSGPLAVENALQIGLQIAQALEAAHEKGVVHRDLKPANVMVTAKGQVKVLDFGLAKAFSEEANAAGLGQSPALSLAMTQQGIILGTAGYMSPEQASGQATDQRADIWAFGVVLFEMLSGLPLFVGESVPHILADILKTEPDWKRLPKNLHPRLKMLLERCLEKRPRSRYHAIADARIDIEAVLSDPDASQWQRESSVGAVTSGSFALHVATPVVVTAVVAALVGWAFWPVESPQPVSRFDYDFPPGQALRAQNRRAVDISSDGRRFVYNTGGGLYLRPMGELEARLISGTEGTLSSPTFSPDGQTLAYWAFGQLIRIAISGGSPIPIAGAEENFVGMNWAQDGMIYFADSNGIGHVAATGGTPEVLIPVEDGRFFSGPQLLPGEDLLLFTSAPGPNWDLAQSVVQSLSTGKRTVLFEGGSDARYLQSGHIVYSLGSGLFARTFDIDGLSVGSAVPVLQDVRRSSTGGTPDTHYSVSKEGTLIYLVGTVFVPQRVLVWVDRNGRETPIDAPPRAYTYPRLSPDGSTVALDVRDRDLDIWTWNIEQETLTRLTFSSDQDEFPTWALDGSRLAFNSAGGTAGTVGGSRLSWKPADGSGQDELIYDSDGQLYPVSFVPDGTGVLARGNSSSDDILLVRFGEDGNDVTPVIATEFEELNPEISPDGQWLAYTSNESGDFEVYVRPFPDIDSGRWQISTDGGVHPVWSRDGTELFYRDGDALMVTSVRTDPTFSRGNPEVLFEGEYFRAAGGRTYDVSLDGERFLMIKDLVDASATPQIIIVQNWLEELERLAPTGR